MTRIGGLSPRILDDDARSDADGSRAWDGVEVRGFGSSARPDAFVLDRGMPTARGGSCGSTATAIVLNQFGLFGTSHGVDALVRAPLSLGGSITSHVNLLRAQGLEAEWHAGGDWESLRHALEQGYGVMVNYMTLAGPHTEAVVGMFRDAEGNEFIQFAGEARLMSRADFESRWHIDVGAVDLGLERGFTIVAAPGQPLPAAGDPGLTALAAPVLAFHEAFSAAVVAITYFEHGEVLGGSARLLQGVLGLAVTAVPMLVQIAGASLEALARQGLQYAERLWAADAASQFGALFIYFFAALAVVLGACLRVPGQLVGMLTAAAAQLVCAPLRVLADWAFADDAAVLGVRPAMSEGIQSWVLRIRLAMVPASGRARVIQTLLEGAVSAEERQTLLFILRLSSEYPHLRGQDVSDLEEVLASVDRARLEQVFAGTEEQAAFRELVPARGAAETAHVTLPRPS